MKYVIVQKAGMAFAILFPETVQHCEAFKEHPDMALAAEAVSAGFFDVKDGAVDVWGQSTSLGLKSRPEDAETIEWTLRLSGLKQEVAPAVAEAMEGRA